MCMRKRIWTTCKILMVWCVTLCLLLEQKGAEVFAEAQELYAGMYAVDENAEHKQETDVNILDAVCFRSFSYESM